MRPQILALVIACAAGTAGTASIAHAQPSDVPEQCTAVASIPGNPQVPSLQLHAKLSLANCSAEARLSALKLAPDDASIQALASAAKPSLDLYDQIIAANDPALTLVAKQARADLLVSMVVRMRNSIPPITMQTVGDALAEHDRAHAALEAKLKPWLDQAG